jgi:hypothetical protein
MKKLMSVIFSLILATSAYAGGWGIGVSVNIGVPVYTPAPVVYYPAVYSQPVYIPRPVVCAPAPVVYVPAQTVYPQTIGIVFPTPVTVYFPATFHHRHHFRR